MGDTRASTDIPGLGAPPTGGNGQGFSLMRWAVKALAGLAVSPAQRTHRIDRCWLGTVVRVDRSMRWAVLGNATAVPSVCGSQFQSLRGLQC